MVESWQAVLIALITSIPWLAVVLLIYKTPEKIEKWYSIIARSFSWISLTLEKSAVASDIQSDLKSFAKNINSQAQEPLLPYGVKIDWVKSESREAFVRKKQIVIKMRHHENQAKNFLYATMEYVTRGLIPEARHLLDKTVLRSVDLISIKKILTEKRRHDARQLFYDEIYEAEATKGSLLERYCAVFDTLDSFGYFSAIALSEFSRLGKKLGSRVPNTGVRLETVRFVEMLERFTRRRHGEDVSPTHEGENIKCSIVLIARPEVYLAHGLAPYLNWINKCCQKGIDSFYVCAMGDANISIVRRIRDAYGASKKISVASENIYDLSHGNKSIVLVLKRREEGQLAAAPSFARARREANY